VLRRLSSGNNGYAWGAFFWNALGAIVLAILLARWTWIWFAPRTPDVLPVTQSNHTNDAERLFGVSALTQETTMPMANLALLGIFSGRNGFAVFEVDGKRQIGVAIGGEISPGMKLLEIAGDHVIVGKDAGHQRIDLKGAAAKR
jgi:hypothetical protein